MIIGLDFDNTIVRYDRVFYEVALEKSYINPSTAISKVAVRDAMQASGLGDAWTEMQGYVYGCRMDLAEIFSGAVPLMRAARDSGRALCKIISHKTRKPYRGPAYDLHQAARDWIGRYLVDEKGALIAPENISFHETKAEKIAHIENQKCDVFLDDLPEILNDSKFPASAKPVLFDPDQHHIEQKLTRVANWNDFTKMLDF